jgi:hypothetical protein
MSETLYAAIMAVLAIITGLYLLSIGFALHTPRFRRPLSAEALAKLRVWGKVAGAASLLLGALYFFAALPSQ